MLKSVREAKNSRLEPDSVRLNIEQIAETNKRATVYTKSDPMRTRAVRPALAAGPVVAAVAVPVKKEQPERAAHSTPLVSAPVLLASCFTSSS